MTSNSIRELSFDDVVKRLREASHASRNSYLAMYSTWYGGIVKSPELMMVPVDDHMVHRGDGVFEAVKCAGRRIYALDRHLQRLEVSAAMIGLTLPHTLDEVRNICIETVKSVGVDDCLLRLYVSRGPGSFAANPYDSFASQFYLVVTAVKPVSERHLTIGVRAKTSAIAVKEGIFSTVKSCNYLPNVLMKKEAVDSGVDFVVSRDEHGHLAEGSTENFAIVSSERDLIVPLFDRTLKGVTAVRMMELVQAHLCPRGLIRNVRNSGIALDDVAQAREAMVLGTTIDCLPVTSYDGRAVGDGRPGPVARESLKLILEDIKSGPLSVFV